MNRKRLNKLRAIYAEIPEVHCKGLCYEACSVIGMERVEFVQLTRASGGDEPSLRIPEFSCNYLDGEKRCTVYEDRPAICRLFGTGTFLPCPYGCSPAKPLTNEQSLRVLDKINREFGNGSRSMIYNAPQAVVQLDIRRNMYMNELRNIFQLGKPMANCPRCRAHVLYIASETSDREDAVDFAPSAVGTVLINGKAKTYSVLPVETATMLRKAGQFLHTLHDCNESGAPDKER